LKEAREKKFRHKPFSIQLTAALSSEKMNTKGNGLTCSKCERKNNHSRVL
jgi:hypothetical protein